MVRQTQYSDKIHPDPPAPSDLDATDTLAEPKRPPVQNKLLVTGLNAHNQLSTHFTTTGQDLCSFTSIDAPLEAEHIELFHASWSSTAIRVDNKVISIGNQTFTLTPDDIDVSDLFDAFGDHNGLLGCLSTDGRIWLLSDDQSQLECQADPDGSPRIGHIALAGNGRVAMTFKQAPNGRLCHVLSFESLDDLLAWYRDPANVPYDADMQHAMMQGRPTQLLAGTGTFLLRMESGEVYSWGDPRHQSLGRAISDAPAERPAVIEALGGLKITKVAIGGWLNAAVSEDGACYVWGAGTPGSDQTIKCLREADAGELVLVQLHNDRDDGEPLDIVDVAVGDGHIVVLAEGNRCFVAGENRNGQGGLGHDQVFIDDWARLALGSHHVRSIACGPKSTFAHLHD